jgi:hypothetical protein
MIDTRALCMHVLGKMELWMFTLDHKEFTFEWK